MLSLEDSPRLGSHRDIDFFDWEDREAGDFPYYRGRYRIGVGGWILILVGVGFGLLADFTGTRLVDMLPHNTVLRILGAVVVVLSVPGFPLLGVWLAAGEQIKALFRPLTGRDWRLIGILTVVAGVWAVGANWLVGLLGHESVKDAAIGTGSGSVGQNAWLLLELPFLIFGETFFAVLPFLAFLALFINVFKMERKPAVILALVLASLLFGLYHGQAYDWHWAQMLVVIGLGQIITLFGYLKTKNVLVSYLSHLIYDWVIVGLTVLVGLASKA